MKILSIILLILAAIDKTYFVFTDGVGFYALTFLIQIYGAFVLQWRSLKRSKVLIFVVRLFF